MRDWPPCSLFDETINHGPVAVGFLVRKLNTNHLLGSRGVNWYIVRLGVEWLLD